jgi:glycerate 2-kinase
MSPPPRSTLPPLRIACDVTNPLLGPRGAAAVYAPQKGLQARDGARLESLTRETALKLCSAAGVEADRMDRPGAGAAGGTAFGLHVGAGARLLPGFELVAEWLDLERRIHKADIVITGEGHFDASSMEGKGPGAIAERTRALGKKVVVMAGRITAAQLAPGVQAIALTPPGMTLPEALRHTEANLRRVTHELFAAPRSEDPLP